MLDIALEYDMRRRPTVSIRVDERLVLRPAALRNLEDLTEAFLETWPEVSRAMPWIDPDKDVHSQLYDFLEEAERMGRAGLLHHWIMVDPRSDRLIGLIGFDRVTRSKKSDWNLGYWVRSLDQRQGIARRSIDAVLKWIGEVSQMVIEVKVDPNNKAGLTTVNRALQDWGGVRAPEGDASITVAGLRTLHHCHLIKVGE